MLNTSIVRTIVVATGLLALSPSTHAQSQGPAGPNQPPRTSDYKVVSLHRARLDWSVRTSVCLEAVDPDSTAITFKVIGGGAAHGTVSCSASCGIDPSSVGGNAPVSDASESVATDGTREPSRSSRCVYQPDVGFIGKDHFRFEAEDEQGNRSASATVEIDVRNEGLRWELQTAGSTGLTSDANALTDIPKVLGKTAQDFLFVLNWQPAGPRQANGAKANGAGQARQPVVQPRGWLSRNVNFVFQTGMLANPAAVEVKAVESRPAASSTPITGNAPGPGSTQPDAPVESPMKAATQRHFTAGGELNANLVFDADGQGTFIELGATLKGAADVFVGDRELTTNDAGAVLELLRESDTHFRGAVGLRAGLKQYKENTASLLLSGDGQHVLHPANLDDLVYVEFLLQRNSALAGLEGIGERSKNRVALRIAAQPQIAAIAGRPKFLIGLEITRALAGGPPTTKVFYGVNFSGNRLF